MPIVMGAIGSTYQVRSLSGNPKLRNHLMDLGITHGSKVTLLSIQGTNVIIRVRGVRIALDSHIARKIHI